MSSSFVKFCKSQTCLEILLQKLLRFFGKVCEVLRVRKVDRIYRIQNYSRRRTVTLQTSQVLSEIFSRTSKTSRRRRFSNCPSWRNSQFVNFFRHRSSRRIEVFVDVFKTFQLQIIISRVKFSSSAPNLRKLRGTSPAVKILSQSKLFVVGFFNFSCRKNYPSFRYFLANFETSQTSKLFQPWKFSAS